MGRLGKTRPHLRPTRIFSGLLIALRPSSARRLVEARPLQRLRPPQRATTVTSAASVDRAGRGTQGSDWGFDPLALGSESFTYGLRRRSLTGARISLLRGGATFAAGSSAASGGQGEGL